MELREILTYLVWLVGSITFILALKFLASPASARRGNQLGAAGMALVIGWTFVSVDGMLDNWWILLVGGLIGSVVGVLGARRVPMTAMPQMVAIFNGAGGGAAALVADGRVPARHRRAPRGAAVAAVHDRDPARRGDRRGLADRIGDRLRQAAGHRGRPSGQVPRITVRDRRPVRRPPGAGRLPGRLRQQRPAVPALLRVGAGAGRAAGDADRRRRHAGGRLPAQLRTPASRWRPPASCSATSRC